MPFFVENAPFLRKVSTFSFKMVKLCIFKIEKVPFFKIEKALSIGEKKLKMPFDQRHRVKSVIFDHYALSPPLFCLLEKGILCPPPNIPVT